ncbi:ClbS/DfsB family four-helix bundle protein [Lactobacillus xylocopicola]|uniref:ClbS/DfsB family four-helix bundle protein n=1 Tax=Lactobacillus xylocopicola TaxID=2976676 RepID=A0ABM8BGG9_9LACO|nr:ClbS/DfsB family four-helix bundle protein [Lactobacillus xylocopicola]BDR60351.1 hypothetical protein KIM322_06120 [Lactobacillus xylocopicola]
MTRPTNKTELIDASNTAYQKLLALISSLPEDAREADFTFDTSNLKEAHWQRDHNVRDVLAHLYEWQNLLLNWINNNQAGKEQAFLPAGYNWRNYGDLNNKFQEKHQSTNLAEMEELLHKSHEQVMQLLASFTNDELFTKKTFSWTGNNALGSYFISNTSSHYEWALKKLRKHKRSLK